MLNEFDKHHLNLMKNRILSFQISKADLDALLSITRSLEEILNALQNVDIQFKKYLMAEWGELEILSLVMMADDEELLDDKSKQNIFLSLENMKDMIDAALDNRIIYLKQDNIEETYEQPIDRNKMLNQFDRHHLNLMKNVILSFQVNEANLDALLAITRSFEKIMQALKNEEQQLKEALTTEIEKLKLLTSVLIDQEVNTLDTECKQKITLILENMKKMVTIKLDNDLLLRKKGHFKQPSFIT